MNKNFALITLLRYTSHDNLKFPMPVSQDELGISVAFRQSFTQH